MHDGLVHIDKFKNYIKNQIEQADLSLFIGLVYKVQNKLLDNL